MNREPDEVEADAPSLIKPSLIKLDPQGFGALFGIDLPPNVQVTSVELTCDTEYVQKLIDQGRAEGRAEGRFHSILELLWQRDLGSDEAAPIAAALLAEDRSTAVSRAAFDELEQLIALIS